MSSARGVGKILRSIEVSWHYPAPRFNKRQKELNYSPNYHTTTVQEPMKYGSQGFFSRKPLHSSQSKLESSRLLLQQPQQTQPPRPHLNRRNLPHHLSALLYLHPEPLRINPRLPLPSQRHPRLRIPRYSLARDNQYLRMRRFGQTSGSRYTYCVQCAESGQCGRVLGERHEEWGNVCGNAGD